MVNQINILPELKRPTKRVIKEIRSDLMIGYNGCRHALSLSHGVYCALRREKMDMRRCEGCQNFDHEPLEYRLFRRM